MRASSFRHVVRETSVSQIFSVMRRCGDRCGESAFESGCGIALMNESGMPRHGGIMSAKSSMRSCWIAILEQGRFSYGCAPHVGPDALSPYDEAQGAVRD